MLSANGGRFQINHLLFADNTALGADSEEKLCRLVCEFGRVCERRKLRVNVGKSKVMRCSWYGNGDQMHVILNGAPFSTFHRSALKSVLSNGGQGIKAKKCLYEGVIVPTALYGSEAWGMRSAERRKVNVLEMTDQFP